MHIQGNGYNNCLSLVITLAQKKKKRSAESHGLGRNLASHKLRLENALSEMVCSYKHSSDLLLLHQVMF